MENKHTPGPWRYDKNNVIYDSRLKTHFGYEIEIMAKDVDGGPIAICATTKKHAPLIAAAPEMYVMLKLASGYIQKMVADNVQTALPPIVALDRIKQALAHAGRKE